MLFIFSIPALPFENVLASNSCNFLLSQVEHTSLKVAGAQLQSRRDHLRRIGSREEQLAVMLSFEGSDLAESYIAFAAAEVLANQSDSSFNRFGLNPEGGLCGLVCGANVALARTLDLLKADKLSKEELLLFVKNSGDIPLALSKAIAENYTRALNEVFRESADGLLVKTLIALISPDILDPSNGTIFQLLAKAIEETFEKLSMSVRPSLEVRPALLQAETRRGLFLGIVSIMDSLGLEQAVTDATHVIVVLKVDTQTKKIYYSDPNHPNYIAVSSYKSDSQGNFVFKSDLGYFKGRPAIFSLEGFIGVRPR